MAEVKGRNPWGDASRFWHSFGLDAEHPAIELDRGVIVYGPVDAIVKLAADVNAVSEPRSWVSR
jgi:hypothetical protein